MGFDGSGNYLGNDGTMLPCVACGGIPCSCEEQTKEMTPLEKLLAEVKAEIDTDGYRIRIKAAPLLAKLLEKAIKGISQVVTLQEYYEAKPYKALEIVFNSKRLLAELNRIAKEDLEKK